MTIKNSYLYKYCTFDTAKLILSSQLLKFNNPSFFNDPFDCDINLLNFDYSKPSNEILKDMKMVRDKFSQSYGHNEESMERFDSLTKDEIEDMFRGSQLNKLRQTTICCFSKICDSTLMWSHYANNHSGVCLVFNENIEEPFVNIASKKICRGYVLYDNYESINYLESKRDGLYNLFLKKSKHWKYEKEYRFFTLVEHNGYVKFNPNFLSGIIFGLMVPIETINKFKITTCKDFGYNNLFFKRFIKNGLDMKLVRF